MFPFNIFPSLQLYFLLMVYLPIRKVVKSAKQRWQNFSKPILYLKSYIRRTLRIVQFIQCTLFKKFLPKYITVILTGYINICEKIIYESKRINKEKFVLFEI